MSSLFFLAEPNAVADYARASQGSPDDRASFLGITPLELSTLWAIVERAEWEVRMMRLFPIVVAFNVGERIVHEIPAPIVERLASLSLEEIARVAQAWASTSEMAPRGQEVGAIVIEIVRLATRARDTKRSLFLANRFDRR
jgi:hypothetical protein